MGFDIKTIFNVNASEQLIKEIEEDNEENSTKNDNVLNKFKIKMDNGDVFFMTNELCMDDIANRIRKLDTEYGYINVGEDYLLRLYHIVSIELIEKIDTK